MGKWNNRRWIPRRRYNINKRYQDYDSEEPLPSPSSPHHSQSNPTGILFSFLNLIGGFFFFLRKMGSSCFWERIFGFFYISCYNLSFIVFLIWGGIPFSFVCFFVVVVSLLILDIIFPWLCFLSGVAFLCSFVVVGLLILENLVCLLKILVCICFLKLWVHGGKELRIYWNWIES